MHDTVNIWKAMCLALGGGIGWLIGEFRPAFPLIIVTMIFVICDAWTAWRLDKRVKAKYPEKKKREETKFTSFKFSKVIRQTIPKQIVARVAMAAWDNTQSSVSRFSSGDSFDDFNIVCIDPANNLLQLAKVGSRYNRALMERKPVSINFMTQTVVWGGY